jgi:hypothetical protein
MTAEDGKQRLTDVTTAETLLRLVQSVPSPKAEPIKLWLAKVGYHNEVSYQLQKLVAKRSQSDYKRAHGENSIA